MRALHRRAAPLLAVGLAIVVGAALIGPPARAADGGNGPRITKIVRRTVGIVRRVESISGDVKTEETPKQVQVTLAADVLFAFDQADLAPEAAATIDEVASQLRAGGTGEVEVVGYTDSKGSDQYNQDLSLRRSTAVRDALAAKAGGFTYAVSGRGAADPVAPNEKPDGSDNPDGRARNRRVTITYARKG